MENAGQEVLYNEQGSIATITLNRPSARNAYSEAMISALVAKLDEIEANDEIRCVVLTGSGSAFSAGGDLKLMRQHEGMFKGDQVRLRQI